MAKIGFIYSTVDGHTIEICERAMALVEKRGYETELRELTADSEIDLKGWDRAVIGASIRYGKHRPEVARFINYNSEWLTATQSAFFSVNAVARKPEKKEPHTNPYVRKFLKTIRWQPALIGIFGGRIHYAKYRFWDRTMIRFIMWMTKGPTDINANVDFTNWDEVDAFAAAICTLGHKPE
jgi:menaquinone-dependent protoporphyrinogen oxidase